MPVLANIRNPQTRAVTIALIGACFILVGLLIYWFALISELPSTADLQASRFERATVVYAADGTELTTYHDKNRRWISLDEMSPWLTRALIATEDHRFYEHSGIDVIRTVGSIFRTLGGDAQGGSTITMQFARNAFPDIYDDAIITRKIKEWITALRIEGIYEKDDILEMYLNTVPFMYNAFGVEAASQTYFQIPASDLNMKAAATLVGMLKGTVYYNPVRHPERSHERRNTVLAQMVMHGFADQSEVDEVMDEPTRLDFQRPSREDEPAPHFAEYLRQWLDDWAETYNMNLYTDGLRVHTTIDTRLQSVAQSAVDAVGDDLQAVADRSDFSYAWNANPDLLDTFITRSDEYRSLVNEGLSASAALDSLRGNAQFADSLRQQAERVQAGFVAIDPRDGHVLAWVGGRDFGEVQYDHVAVSRRQPGSTFKPFVYAAAIANGYSPNSVLRDEEFEYVDPDTRRRWAPQNVGQATGRLTPLKEALAYSKNTITAQLTIDVGPAEVADFARRMGIKSELDPVPSLGLGTSEVSLLEMASAYGTIANYGQYRDPVFITRIEDQSGNVIARFSGSGGRQAIPATVAYTVLDMMRGVADFGTGVRIRNQYGVRDDVAAKTGTSQNGADGWFMLMHPNVVMGAWVGFSTPALYFRSDYWAQGSHTALPIVGKFYNAAENTAPDILDDGSTFNPPPGWVEPQQIDTTRDGVDDEYARYASYLDSLGMARDSVYSSDDSTWRYVYERDADLTGLSEDTLAINGELDDLDPDETEDVEDDEFDDIEDVEAADSLNRMERRGPLPLDGSEEGEGEDDESQDGENAAAGGDGDADDEDGDVRGW